MNLFPEVSEARLIRLVITPSSTRSSLKDKTNCDSSAIPADIVSNLISNNDIDWFDEYSYDPESKL